MSIKNRAFIFLILTLAISWSAIAIAWINDWRDIMHAGIAPLIFDAGPALAAIICSVAFYRGQQLKVLGIKFRLNRWWLWALLIPIALAAVSLGSVALFSPDKLLGVEGTAWHLADLKHQKFSDPLLYLVSFFLVAAASYSLLAIAEELGWRGYLYHLWRPFGFWRTSFATGLIWGIWHLPLNFWFGANFPEHRLLGLVLFPISTMLYAPIMTFVRDRGQSVWPAVILHGAYNAMGAFIVLAMNEVQFPWDKVVFYVPLAIGALLILLIQRKAQSHG